MPETRSQWGGGSIFELPNGRWSAVVDITEPKGPRRRKKFSGRTRDEVSAKMAAWHEEHPPRVVLGRKEYMRLAREQGTHTEAEFWEKVRTAERRCAYCGKEIRSLDFHGDHIVPVSRGGSDAIDNIAVSCKPCNVEKGTMTGDEYRAWKAGR